MRSLAFIMAASVAIASPVSIPATAQALEPPDRCELEFGSWCIIAGGNVIETRTGPTGTETRQWQVWRDWAPEDRLTIFEPRGCRDDRRPADTAELIALYRRNGEGDPPNKAVVRLRADGSCDLVMEWADQPGRARAMAQVEAELGISVCRQTPCRVES